MTGPKSAETDQEAMEFPTDRRNSTIYEIRPHMKKLYTIRRTSLC